MSYKAVATWYLRILGYALFGSCLAIPFYLLGFKDGLIAMVSGALFGLSLVLAVGVKLGSL